MKYENCNQAYLDNEVSCKVDNRNRLFLIFGVCFGLVSLIIMIFFPLIAIPISIIGVVFAILGRNNSPVLAIIGIIISGLSFILAVVFSFSLLTVVIKGSTLTSENVVSNIEANYKYKDQVYGNWEQVSDNDLLVLNMDGTYEWYLDKNNLSTNFIKGIFTLKNGVNIYNNITYMDSAYLYYHLCLTKMASSVEGVDTNIKMETRQTEYYLGIDISTKTKIVLENIETGLKTYFVKPIDLLNTI